MQLSNIPGKLVLPFANSGNKNSIPVNSQIGITNGAASLADGFPPLTMTPVAAGGVPPSGLDMNGILYELSAIARWVNAGGGYPYDAAFVGNSNVGGYPKGARILRSDGFGYWLNTVDGNTTDPESAGAASAGWVADFTSGNASIDLSNANVTLNALQYGKPALTFTGTVTADLNVIFPAIVQKWTIVNNTTGGKVITCKTASGTGVSVPAGYATVIYCDGTNISAVGYVFTQGGTGAVTRSALDKMREVVSVFDFMSPAQISDVKAGSATIDVTAAIQAAIAYIQNIGGGKLYFQPGVYLVNGTLNVTSSGVRLVGAGRYATTLKFVNGSSDCISVNNGTTYIYGIEVSQMYLDHSGKTGGRSIYFGYVANSKIRDVQIANPWNGVDINITNTIYFEDSTIVNPQNTTGYALQFRAPGDGSARSDVLEVKNVAIDCGYLGADGVRWDGLAQTLNWIGGAILRVRYGLYVTNNAASNVNVPGFLESFALAIEGASSQAVRIEAGFQFRFIDALLTNMSGAFGQGGADTNAVYVGADASYSLTNSLKFVGCRIGLCRQDAFNCAGRSVMLQACTFPNGGMGAAGIYAAIHFLAPCQDVIVMGCTDYEFGASNNYKYGCVLDSGTFRLNVQGNFFYGNSVGPISNSSADYSNRIANNGASQNARATHQILPSSSGSTSGITISAANLLGGYFSRSGPSSNFTDTTDTAANIAAALTDPVINAATSLLIVNGSAAQMTITPGTGVTFSGVTSGGNFVIAAGSSRTLLLYVTNPAPGSAAVTIAG